MLLIGQPLLVEAAAQDAAASVDLSRIGVENSTHFIRWNEGVASGIVVIEAAGNPDETAAWHVLETVVFDNDGPSLVAKVIAGSFRAIRHRVSEVVVDGTVSTRIEASGAW